MPEPVISLTTDFGLADPFIGLMKGVILAIAPKARIVDLCHDLPPQGVVDGALVLESALGYFPEGTIHVAVVDPSVGSDRRAIAVETGRYRYVGPDNGLFTAVLAAEPPVNAVELADDRYYHHPVSATFHGRDIFAPVGAHLAAGVPLSDLGPPVTPLKIQLPEPWQVGGDLELHVLRIDRFGNAVTDLTEARYRQWLADTGGGAGESGGDSGAGGDSGGGGGVICQIGALIIEGVSRTYADVPAGEPLTYFGSTRRLEIAVRDGHAADAIAIDRDTVIRLARIPTDSTRGRHGRRRC